MHGNWLDVPQIRTSQWGLFPALAQRMGPIQPQHRHEREALADKRATGLRMPCQPVPLLFKQTRVFQQVAPGRHVAELRSKGYQGYGHTTQNKPSTHKGDTMFRPAASLRSL